MSRDEIMFKISHANSYVMEIVQAVVKDDELIDSLNEDELLWIGNLARTISGNAQTIMNVTYRKADENNEI